MLKAFQSWAVSSIIATPLGLKPPWSGSVGIGTMTNKTKPLKTLILERSHSWMSSFNTLKPRDCFSGQDIWFGSNQNAQAVNAMIHSATRARLLR
jgi:hypothetical protein